LNGLVTRNWKFFLIKSGENKKGDRDRNRNRDRDSGSSKQEVCFNCGKKGHWYEFLPFSFYQ